MISVVIPTYNSAGKLRKLLDSLAKSPFRDFEIIVVDDGSTDGLEDRLRGYPIRLVRSSKRSGPAAARNLGARNANGDVLLFLDADVIAMKDTLGEVDRFFRTNPAESVMIGVYGPEPVNSGILPWYKALQCSTFYEGKPELSKVSLLWAAKAAFRTSIFLEAGGFDEVFDRPSMEDLELGRRISKRASIWLNKRVVVRHHFPSTFRKNAADHWDRGYLWTKIFFRYGKFDNYLHTPRRGFGRIAAFASAVVLPVGVFFPPAWVLSAAAFAFYLACNLDLWLVVIRRAPKLLIASAVVDWMLGVVLGAAALRATLEEVGARGAGIFRGRSPILIPDEESEPVRRPEPR